MSDQTQQLFNIEKLYLKDVSFESPNAPAVFAEGEWKPEIKVQINSANRQVEAELYEVVLNITVTAKHDDKTAFLVEIKQAGLFKISGFTDENLGGVLGAYCPESLFPFAREAIAELISAPSAAISPSRSSPTTSAKG